MQEAWSAEGLHPEERWIQVPDARGADAADVETWIDGELEKIQGWWGEAWTDDIVQETRALLTSNLAIELPPGTLMCLLHCPVPAPVVSRVRVAVGDGGPVGVAEWEQMGFEVDAYSDASLGPGLRCLSSQTGEGGVEVHTGVFVFAAEEFSVMVVVEAISPEVFGFTFTEVPLILSTLDVIQPDGAPFTAQPVPGLTHDPLDVWEESPLA